MSCTETAPDRLKSAGQRVIVQGFGVQEVPSPWKVPPSGVQLELRVKTQLPVLGLQQAPGAGGAGQMLGEHVLPAA